MNDMTLDNTILSAFSCVSLEGRDIHDLSQLKDSTYALYCNPLEAAYLVDRIKEMEPAWKIVHAFSSSDIEDIQPGEMPVLINLTKSRNTRPSVIFQLRSHIRDLAKKHRELQAKAPLLFVADYLGYHLLSQILDMQSSIANGCDELILYCSANDTASNKEHFWLTGGHGSWLEHIRKNDLETCIAKLTGASMAGIQGSLIHRLRELTTPIEKDEEDKRLLKDYTLGYKNLLAELCMRVPGQNPYGSPMDRQQARWSRYYSFYEQPRLEQALFIEGLVRLRWYEESPYFVLRSPILQFILGRFSVNTGFTCYVDPWQGFYSNSDLLEGWQGFYGHLTKLKDEKEDHWNLIPFPLKKEDI